ncbi:MAG TPA: ATP-binding protein [Acidobacteriaceae bacterium]|nr:ATP-binding protein [Acidobacteriaceae bacterium]
MTPLPIRLRLTLWNFAVLSCAGVVLSAATWFLLQQSNQRLGMASAEAIPRGQSPTVHAAVSQATSIALLQVYARDLLMLAPLLLCLAALIGYWMSRKAMHPLTDLARVAGQICQHSVNLRIPVSNVKDEISKISTTLNEMLNRVDAGNRSIRDFTADASHELQSPVALIRSEVEAALFSPRSNEEYRESFANLHQEVVHMSGLVDNMLMLARADAGTEILEFEVIDAGRLVRRVGEKWSRSMRQAMLEFAVETCCVPALIRADLVSIQRLLDILLENASRYTPPGGSITLRATADSERVLLEVRDTGIGISGEHLPRLFQRFYRVDSVRSRQLGGSGLGLALAKWIADQHQATLIVESEVGVGTCFRFAIEQQHTAEARLRKSLVMAGSI